jgi:hypothetical protein
MKGNVIIHDVVFIPIVRGSIVALIIITITVITVIITRSSDGAIKE